MTIDIMKFRLWIQGFVVVVVVVVVVVLARVHCLFVSTASMKHIDSMVSRSRPRLFCVKL